MPQIDGGPPLYCWIVTVNSMPQVYEFQMCYECLDRPSQDRVKALTAIRSPEALPCMVGRLIPHIIMNQRGALPGTWRIEGNDEGKKPRLLAPTMEKQIGYSTARSEGVVSFAFALGREDRVAQVGCDVRRVHLSKQIPLETFLASISHKLCDTEMRALQVSEDIDRDRIIGRVYILWTLKEALMKAIGQPLRGGFDWRRVCFDVERELVFMDQRPITGWEFKLFVARVPNSGKMLNKTYKYQVACAIHRGGDTNKFTWNQRGEAMDEWLRFITMETVMERVWSFPYQHIQKAAALRPQEEAARRASMAEAPGLNGFIPGPFAPTGSFPQPSSREPTLPPYVLPAAPVSRRSREEIPGLNGSIPPPREAVIPSIPPQLYARAGSSTNASRSNNKPGR